MENSGYIEALRTVIQKTHGCDSVHVGSERVKEVSRGQTIWQGSVEVFELKGHPKAKRAYAWGEKKSRSDPGAQFFAVLELPPVDSAKKALQAAIASQILNPRQLATLSQIRVLPGSKSGLKLLPGCR